MFKITKKTLKWGDNELSLESGRVARQADGAVLAQIGKTVVLCTATAAKESNPALDFLPLSVHYIEKTYAAGKIPGGFFKREGRPSERETLTSRLIDRPIRPLFPSLYKCETQVICTVLSHDMENDPDMVALIGASAALAISGLPFQGPIAGARIGRIDGKLVLNPKIEDMEESNLDLVVAGTSEGVLMVESQADELSEDVMLEAVTFGHTKMQPVIAMIEEMKKECGRAPRSAPDHDAALAGVGKAIKGKVEADLRKAYQQVDKGKRVEAIAALKKDAGAMIEESDPDNAVFAAYAFKQVERDIVRQDILKTSKRIDKRGLDEIRAVDCQADVLPMTHGSALFTRGETQALAAVTLGTGQDEQIIDALAGEYREHFMLHYNFPPFSVGEVSRVGATSRREVGHGKLAWRALRPLMPSKEDFPYTIRVVSEVTESNGSSSMATVCASSLALMDAGVRMPRPVAGIAMGLIKEGKDFAILSDILGDEDHLGDMDFKVAGTEKGLTSLQMDIKITSITPEIMKQALEQGRAGRLHLLKIMAKLLSSPREKLNANAPKITQISIHKDKIREVIGSGGKVIREICETSGAKIDIEDDGTVRLAAPDGASIEKALEMIEGITAEPEVGRIYDGKVVKCVDFGAFVNFLGRRDGLVHISELAEHRVQRTRDVVSEGDQVKVKVIGVDDRGKVRLSMKEAN